MEKSMFNVGDRVVLSYETAYQLEQVLYDKLESSGMNVSRGIVKSFTEDEFIIVNKTYLEGSDRYVYNIKPYNMNDIDIDDLPFSKQFQFAERRLVLVSKNTTNVAIESWKKYFRGE